MLNTVTIEIAVEFDSGPLAGKLRGARTILEVRTE
jgi:hypothetical protein